MGNTVTSSVRLTSQVTMLILVMLVLVTMANGQDSSCHLPAGDAGLCVDIAQCGHLTKLISNLQKPFPRDVSLLIRDSFLCGSSGTSVSVCCPRSGLVTPVTGQPETETFPRRSEPECAMQAGAGAQCVTYSQCSPFVQLLVNIKKPLDPVVPAMIRSSFLCGTDDSSGRIVPKICCPSAALTANQKPETSTPKEPENKYQSHPGIQLIADKDSCGRGQPDKRIVGGQDAPQGKFPWLVNLGYQQDSKGEKVFKCGGSLIGPRHIVTAAHCVTQLPRGFVLTTIRVGEHDLDKDVDCDPPATCPPPQDIAVEDIIFHPSYGSPEAFQNDIAVVALSRNVTQNEFVVPICLPWEDDNESYLDGGRSGPLSPITEVAGWGATTITGRKPANILQYLDVSVTDTQECKNIYKERGGILGEKQICAGGVKGKDSCVGDSGSALMRSLPDSARSGLDRWDLIGVVSFGPRLCGTEGVPGVYTRVNSYLEWILDTVNSSR